MRLKSITLKGFKSFPDRTRLEFGSGVSVIVGPNGSGKSNVTDAVLWALGEQSPLAVRGQTMQDVIFGGGAGTKGRNAAEVEVVIDNSDGRLRSEFSEIAITRRLDRAGEGGYQLNGARCRLVDVIEVLSDSGLGKEMHSVISQGRVDAIVSSRPVDRTALIEEAAGLSKHRKRRHRAQLKLERTQDNLDRALDVEREARSRLRPLKRQAEAAELHARLEQQSLEVRGTLVADRILTAREELSGAERAAAESRARRDAVEAEQADVARRREAAERGFAEHGREREQLSSQLFSCRSAADRMSIRLESVTASVEAIDARLARARSAVESTSEPEAPESDPATCIASLEAELEGIDAERAERLAAEVEGIERARVGADQRTAELEGALGSKAGELERLERELDEARAARRLEGERADAAARRRAELEVEREALMRRLAPEATGGPPLADKIEAEAGLEAALSAVLGERLLAVVVDDLTQGEQALRRAVEGGRALVKGTPTARGRASSPLPGARRLLDHVRADADVQDLVETLLGDAWLVERLSDVPGDFEGTAVTAEGLVYHGAARELRSFGASGSPNALANRGRRAQVEAELERTTAEIERARAAIEAATLAVGAAEQARETLETELRDLRRQREEAVEEARRSAWLIERRRELHAGTDDERRSEVMAELAAERRLGARLARERSELVARRRRLEASIERDSALLPVVRRLRSALESALAASRERQGSLEEALAADEAVGERAAAELRELAQAEYAVQARLREAGEGLTEAEVRVAHVRDREQSVAGELDEIAARLGVEPTSDTALDEAERAELEARLERVERRRERLGPVNPLAESEYEDAVEHVEDLERQRTDLEAALAELQNLIRETDRRIRESFETTFDAAAKNFEEVIEQLFPGGRGKLRLITPSRPRPVLGGGDAPSAAADGEGPDSDPETAEDEAGPRDETPGIEIEVTPAGKTTKRLSLLSGGERSLVALGFLFAVFLARPCPFYILDEVEAALDDLNIDRFLSLVRRYCDRSQFIIITHQRRTMEAADVLYGVSMGKDGITKIVSRRLEGEEPSSPAPKERLTEAA